MVILQQLRPVRKAAGYLHFHLILRLILPVAAFSLRLPVLHAGDRFLSGQFPDIIHNAVFVAEFLGFKFVSHLIAEHEQQPRIDDRLSLEHLSIVLYRDIDIGKNIQIRFPADAASGFFLCCLFLMKAAYILPLLKAQRVAISIPEDLDIHIFGGILRRAKAQAVESQGIFVTLALIGFVFAARVQLAKAQFPVVPSLIFIKINRDTGAKVLYLYRSVFETGDNDLVAPSLSGFIDRIGEDFKNGMLAAFDPVGAKNNPRTLAHPIRAFQRLNTFIIIRCFLCHRVLQTSIFFAGYP